jgi:ADP-ribosyl-[dinitrogen reductase] hydrolase
MPPTTEIAAGQRASRDRYRGCLLGLACGDAVGTTVEFQRRGSFEAVTDMVGGGPFGLAAGEWTDDTSMALCLATSLLERGGFDPADQMRRYCRWQEEGYLSSNGRCFDIGNTVASALSRFRATGEAFSGSTDPRSAGNGSLMRLAPVAMFFAPDVPAATHHAALSSRTTHGCTEAVDACRLFAAMLLRALDGAPKQAVLDADAEVAGTPRGLCPSIRAIHRGHYRAKPATEIRGSGYVAESLEAALWCFANTGSYRDAILAAVNLGDDADTTAAVCGQIAGAHYGAAGIPPRWRSKLAMRGEIEALADALQGAGGQSAGVRGQP